MEANSKETTLSQTIKKFGKRLFNYIKGKVNLREDAEDIMQEVWYQFSKLSNIDELESISGWLYTVSRSKINDLYRKRKTDHLDDLGLLDEDDSDNPELNLFREMFWSELFKALDTLPENQKQVFVLHEIEDKSLQEIADETGENIKTIISRKGYAVKHLRKKLLPVYQEFTS